MCFENYVPFHLIRCTILEIHPTAMKVFGWISHAPIHPALTKQASVAMRPCWVAQSCKKGNWRAFYHHKHLLSWLDGWLCSHTTKVADAPFVFPWSPGHSFCLKRKIFSSTFLMLLSYISKGLADSLQYFRDILKRNWAELVCSLTSSAWHRRWLDMEGSSLQTTQGAHHCWTFGVHLQLRCCGLSASLSRGSRPADVCTGMAPSFKMDFQHKARISHPWKDIACLTYT